MPHSFLCGRFELKLERPLVMGIVNITPDSFSDGGVYADTDAALAHGRQLMQDGADILDLGGESSRPGAMPVSLQEEIQRLLPVVEGLRDCGLPLSVDTCKPAVMRAVLDAGADMINDIYAFRQAGAIEALGQSSCGLCVMHMQGEPCSMQHAPQYAHLINEVRLFLHQRVQSLGAAGVDTRRIALDPGFGFGKTANQNYLLLRELAKLRIAPYPLLVGVSRKSMIGQATGRPVGERKIGSVAAALACVARGANLLRVHDVAATVDALKVWHAAEQGALP